MPKVNITEAARLAGITRQYLHKKYINKGLITVEKGEGGSPQIDTTEIMRVFGRLKEKRGDSKQTAGIGRELSAAHDTRSSALQAEISALREQLSAAVAREKWLQGAVDQLAEQLAVTSRLLEHSTAGGNKRRWWPFA